MSELKLHKYDSIDIYAKPLSLRPDVMALSYPVHFMFNWDFGFTIYCPETLVGHDDFYSKPFSNIVWCCLFCTAIFCAVFFYFLRRWEIKLVYKLQWESGFVYEVLMVIGAYCQHIPPIDAVLYSRRGAYLTFFMFAYLIYTYYTSNLLSHLVNDKNNDIDVHDLLESDMDFVILEDVMSMVSRSIADLRNNKNITKAYRKLLDMKSVTVLEGLRAVKNSNTALLAEFQTIEPYIRSVFKNHEICSLTNINLFTNLRKYFYVSKGFPYKEEFKIALQRMEETGVLQRMRANFYSLTECIPLTHVQTQLSQILPLLSILLAAYLVSVVILMGEIIHSRMNRLWPYLD